MCIIPQLVFFHALQFPRIFFVTSLNMITDTLLVLGLAGGFRGGPVGGLCMVCTYCRCFSVFEPCLLLYYVVFLCVTIMNFCGGHARMGIVPDCDCDIYNMDMHVHNICMYNYVYIWVCNVIYIYIETAVSQHWSLFLTHHPASPSASTLTGAPTRPRRPCVFWRAPLVTLRARHEGS